MQSRLVVVNGTPTDHRYVAFFFFGLESGIHPRFFLGATGRLQHALRFASIHP
jgi:hypothetical protein